MAGTGTPPWVDSGLRNMKQDSSSRGLHWVERQRHPAWPHLHPGIEDIEEREGVTLVAFQWPPGSGTVQVALGTAGEW